MATIQVTYFLSDQHGHGWSENFYTQADTVLAARDVFGGKARGDPSDLFIARRRLLAVGFRIEEVRVSDVAIFRDSLVFSGTGGVGDGEFNARTPDDGEQAWDRLLIRMEAGAVTRRAFEMGGIPASIIDQNGTYTPSPLWNTRFARWKGMLLNGPIVFLRRKNAPQFAGATVKFPVLSVAVAGKRLSINVSTTDWGGSGISPGEFVRLSSFRNTSGVNGLWQVQSAAMVIGDGTQTGVIFKPRRHFPLWVNGTSQPGTFASISSTFLPITDIISERGVRRKTGRPFDSPHGRSPNLNPG